MIQLSKEQIDKIFEFTRTKNIPYEDVRYEIVDHLASDVEAQMDKDSNIEFQRAMDLAYGKFPITGFVQFIHNKEKALSTYWNKRILKVLASYFTFPRILLTLVVFIANYQLAIITSNFTYAAIGVILGIITAVSAKFFLDRSFKSLDVKYLFFNEFRKKILVLAVFTFYLFHFGRNWNWLLQPSTESVYSITTSFFAPAMMTINVILMFALATGGVEHLIKNEISTKYRHLGLKF